MENSKEDILKLLEEFTGGGQTVYSKMENSYELKNFIKDKKLRALTSSSWTSGGITGGNCWGGEANQAVSTEEPARLTELDNFLELHFPAITFLQYRKIEEHIKIYEYSQSEYYGNYTENSMYYIPFDKLAETLSDVLSNTEKPAKLDSKPKSKFK